MALVNLKDVKVYATFKGGFRVVEESTGRNGETYKQRFTVWVDATDSGPIHTDDVVSLSGFLSAKVHDWTDKDGAEKHSVELSVNKPRISGREEAPEQPAGESWAAAPAGDVWNTPSTDESEGVPF